MQETHSHKGIERWWSSQWGNKIWFSHGESNARGVAILFAKKLKVEIHNVITSPHGRYIVLYITLGSKKFVLLNIYAPNKDTPHFFRAAFKDAERFSPDHHLIGGDFNTGLATRLDRMGMISNNDRSSQWITQHLGENDYSDIWRVFKKDENGYTWRKRHPKPAYSRLDYFVISDNALQFVDSIEVIPGFRTDHSIICLILSLEVAARRPGYWKLNTSILKDQDYINKMNQLLDIQMELYKEYRAKCKWELVKLAACDSSIQYCKFKSRTKKNKIHALEEKLKHLEKEAVLPDNPQVLFNTEEQIRLVKHDIQELMRIKTAGVVMRSRSKWEFLAGKPTKYFLNLEKNKFNKKNHPQINM